MLEDREDGTQTFPAGSTNPPALSGTNLVQVGKLLKCEGIHLDVLPATAVTRPAIATANPADYQVIGDQVFRMEISFLLNSGTSAPVLSGTPYLSPHTTVNGMADVSAIVVAIAVLDTKSRAIVPANALTNAAGQLEDSGTAAPATLWQKDLTTGNLGLPAAAAAQIRVYQRFFYLNPIE